MICPGPDRCPFHDDTRFRLVLKLVGLLMVLMTTVALSAVCFGKDGVITSAVCACMGTVVTAVLVGGIHRHESRKQ